MVSRLSVNALLKSVIAIMGAAVMIALLLSAWGSWNRLQITNQIAAAADSSKYLFTTLHNLRTDRGMTNRELLADRAKGAGVGTCVFDRGGYQYHGRVKALAEGAREGGLKF